MARRLVLLRHARIAADRVGRMIGSTDVELDALGHRQAAAVGPLVRRWHPERFFVSPLVRCRQTAAAAMPHIEFTPDDDLREIDFGRLEDRSFSEAAREDPTLAERWREFSPEFTFPGGESIGGFAARIIRAADRLACDEAPTVMAVTHKGVIRAMICHLLGLAAWQYVLFQVDYASLVVIDLFDGRGVLAAIERLHLDSSLGEGIVEELHG